MRSKDNLFHLIKAMSKSEKRYFVLDAKKSGRDASRYLSLFEAMSNMEDLDEEKLKAKFAKNLSSDKAYLYEAILRSMRDYRSPSSKAAQVKERLMDARFLYERGLYDQSTQRIMEAKAMARELEDQFTLLEINKEEQVSVFDRRAKVELEYIEKLNEERINSFDAISEELRYLDLYYRLLLELYQEFNLKDESIAQILKDRLPIELLNEESKPNSPQALQRYYLCNAAYFSIVGDLEKVHHYYLKAAEWWERFPVLKEEEFHRYINAVHNLVNTSYKMEKYFPVANEWIEKLRVEQPRLSYHNQKIIFRTISISNLLHHLNRNDFKKAKNLLPEIIEGLSKFGLKKSVVLLANIVTVYFLVEDYLNCIKWSNYLLNNLKSGEREDIQRLLRLYKVISFYEMDMIDEAEAEVRSANRYFKSIGLPKGRFEDVVLNHHLKRIFFAPLSELKEARADFKSYLQNIVELQKAEYPLGVDELLIWIGKKKS